MKTLLISGILFSFLALGLCSCFAGQPAERAAVRRMKAKEYFQNPTDAKFVEAVAKGDTKTLSKLVQEGVDVNATGVDGMRPLFWAIGKDSLKGFEFLLLHGADPNVVAGSSGPDSPEVSVMGFSAISSKSEYLKLALKYGGDPNFRAGYGNRTIIYEAILNNRIENVRILIEAGANLSHRDTAGATPVATAAAIRNYDMVYLFLEKGADPSIKDRWGYDLSASMKKYGTRGIDPDSEQYQWYLKVVAEMKKRGFLQ